MKLSRRPQTVRAPILGEHEGFAEARLIYLRDFTFRAWRFTVRISLFFSRFRPFAAHSVPRENLPGETSHVRTVLGKQCVRKFFPQIYTGDSHAFI